MKEENSTLGLSYVQRISGSSVCSRFIQLLLVIVSSACSQVHNRVWMLYRIRNGLVAIPPGHLKPTTVATRRHETHYLQIRCNSILCTRTARPYSQVQSDYGTHITTSCAYCTNCFFSALVPVRVYLCTASALYVLPSLITPCGATSFGGHYHLLNQNQNRVYTSRYLVSATYHRTASSWSCRRLTQSDHAPSFYLTALHNFTS